jgi:predicted Zn-dependent peptidase
MQETVERINRITAQRVQEVAEQLFTTGAPTLAGIGPVGKLAEVDAIGDLLKR